MELTLYLILHQNYTIWELLLPISFKFFIWLISSRELVDLSFGVRVSVVHRSEANRPKVVRDKQQQEQRFHFTLSLIVELVFLCFLYPFTDPSYLPSFTQLRTPSSFTYTSVQSLVQIRNQPTASTVLSAFLQSNRITYRFWTLVLVSNNTTTLVQFIINDSFKRLATP